MSASGRGRVLMVEVSLLKAVGVRHPAGLLTVDVLGVQGTQGQR
jgi:hypothetical protein